LVIGPPFEYAVAKVDQRRGAKSSGAVEIRPGKPPRGTGARQAARLAGARDRRHSRRRAV
jgi:hypothetical protein